MFHNKPTARNKEKQPVVKKRVQSTKKMNRESGIFTTDKTTKSRTNSPAINSASSTARETPRHEKKPDTSAGDNGATMLQTMQGKKVSLIVGWFSVAIDCILF